MMKGGLIIQAALDQENMSNVTSSASGDNQASVSDINGGSTIFPQQQQQQFFANTPQPAVKKKRNQPGNPDPAAEVIALSPKTLMATNRFVCEICNKGFQRDQNLQLHRRGHNLPWKLKQRAKGDVIRKKVYVCPEANCAHHDPSRALGDLTGIKKHFCRKHGEKKWKCEKCSKRYAVQSDWKAHSKTCGTREYRCDCGSLFSRRDSFITHRAFCDALTEESARGSITGNPIIHPSQPGYSSALANLNFQFQPVQFSIKREQHHHGMAAAAATAGFNLRPEIPPWLMTCQPLVGATHGPPPPMFQEFNAQRGPTLSPFLAAAASVGLESGFGSGQHISASALLQKAAQMPKMGPVMLMGEPHTADHVTANQTENLSSRDAAAGGPTNYDVFASLGRSNKPSLTDPPPLPPPPTTMTPHGGALLHDITTSVSSTAAANSFSSSTTDPHGFDASSFEDPFGCIGAVGGGGANDDMTKDFLGLRPLSHSDIFNITSFVDNPDTDHHLHHAQSQKAWPS